MEKKELFKVGTLNLAETIKRLRANDPTLQGIEFDPYQGPTEDWKNLSRQTADLSALADAIATNVSLKTFKYHTDVVSGVVAGRILGRMLARNSGLDMLDLCCLDLQSEGAQELAKGLSANKTLRHLKSSHAKIGDRGIATISKAMEVNKALRSVEFGYEDIGDAGAAAFAQMLRKTKTLVSFALPNNKISDEGMAILLDALIVNKSVEKANLSHLSMQLNGDQRKISKKAWQKLNEMVRKNKKIVDLDLSYTTFSAMSKDYDVAELGASLAANNTIARLGLEVWGLFPKYFDRLAGAMKGNKSLAYLGGIDGNSYRDLAPDAMNTLTLLADAMRDNPNFVSQSHYIADSPVLAVMEEHRTALRSLIDKIHNPKVKLSAADAALAKKAIHGLYLTAFDDESKRTEKDASGYYRNYEVYMPLARKYAHNTLQIADKKMRQSGYGGLSIPEVYRYESPSEHPTVKTFSPAVSKVNFAKVDLKKAFTRASGSTSITMIAYKAAKAGQVDELLDNLKKQGLSLGSRELLFRPGKDDLTLIELIAVQEKLTRVMTFENWKSDPAGIDKVVEVVPHAVLAAQLEGHLSIEELKWEIESSTLRRGRAPIRIKGPK